MKFSGCGLVLLIAFGSSSGCVAQRGKGQNQIAEVTKKSGNILTEKGVPAARFLGERQRRFLEEFLAMDDSKEAFALFSFSGWTNGGKTIRVFNKKSGELLVQRTDLYSEAVKASAVIAANQSEGKVKSLLSGIKLEEPESNCGARDGWR